MLIPCGLSFQEGTQVFCFAENLLRDLERFKSLVHCAMKSGSRVLCLHDSQCGDRPHKNQHPNLFRMARLKEATV